MKRLICLTFALAMSMANSVRAQQSEVLDGIAAVVNGDVITYSDVRELIGSRERALRSSYQGTELDSKIKEMRLAALKDLIDRQLIIQEFKKREKDGVVIPQYLIDDAVQTVIRQDFGGDRAAFVRTLKAQGYTVTKFKEVQRDQIIVRAMKSQYVKDDFVISPTQIQNFYDKHKADYSTPEQIKLRMIVLREGDDADNGPAGGKKEMAQEIRTKLASGADFGRMAQMYSEDSDSQKVDGDWGWIDRKQLSPELTTSAFALRAGEISEVVTVGNSYYIMMVEARKNAAVKTIGEVRDEIEQNLINVEKNASLQRWLDTLRQGAYIKIYS
ncbi:MAG TPA: peptidyl-prolyl cis-trans isomerase [Chthoniobacterales bacterium]|nr:peptidyl-prolyl cis-trans isomerase [Chthoniobacterales bacterium]